MEAKASAQGLAESLCVDPSQRLKTALETISISSRLPTYSFLKKSSLRYLKTRLNSIHQISPNPVF